jgi:hypothetical protein
MIDWISKYVDTSSGIPSSQTLKRVMSLIPIKSLGHLLDNLKSNFGDFLGDVIAQLMVKRFVGVVAGLKKINHFTYYMHGVQNMESA